LKEKLNKSIKLIILIILNFLLLSCQPGQEPINNQKLTFCNPVNISYRFGLDEPSRREAADPTVVSYRDEYYLFASKSGGYWYSGNLVDWNFVETQDIPTEDYAPTVIAINDTLYFLASAATKNNTIYKTAEPKSGRWTIAKEELDIPVWDPAFFLDCDNRLYLYWGCSNNAPIYGVELNFKDNFSFIGEPKELIFSNKEKYGWEVRGDYNKLVNTEPWIEGAWMNKYKGKYYLQYSGPGTQFKSYADGVYISDNPLGPYKPQKHNPFAYKPEGFAAGAGHGSTLTDQYGNYWHFGTISISQKHRFERRLGLFPSYFDENGTLYSITKYGDYPLIIPQKKVSTFDDIFSGWMLLSYGKRVEVSSSVDSLQALNINDEDIRTYWSARSGKSGEFAILDLGNLYNVNALQVNFAEHNTNLFGRTENLYHRYIIEYSLDNITWKMLIDKSKNENDNTHNYFPLGNQVSCRYLKITNIKVPSGNFALSGFRIFGKGDGYVPDKIDKLIVKRNPQDKRSVNLKWKKTKGAIGYNISYGVDKNKLYHNYMVYEDTSININTLNTDLVYYFTIEAFNENGIASNNIIIKVE